MVLVPQRGGHQFVLLDQGRHQGILLLLLLEQCRDQGALLGGSGPEGVLPGAGSQGVLGGPGPEGILLRTASPAALGLGVRGGEQQQRGSKAIPVK